MVALIETKSRSRAITPRVVDVVDRQHLHGAVVVRASRRAAGCRARTSPRPCCGRSCLRVPVTTPRSTRSTTPSESSSVWMPRSRWSRSAPSTALGIAADADLQRGAVGDPLDDRARRSRSSRSSGAAGGTSTSGRSASQPAEHLRDVDLVEAERARHPRVDLEEERHAADERGDVVGVRAQREVAVPVGRAGRGEHERAARARRAAARGTSEKWLGTRSQPPLQNACARRRREEVGDVAQVVARTRRGGRAGRAARASGARARRSRRSWSASSASSSATGSPLASGTMRSAPGGTCASTSSRRARRPAGDGGWHVAELSRERSGRRGQLRTRSRGWARMRAR